MLSQNDVDGAPGVDCTLEVEVQATPAPRPRLSRRNRLCRALLCVALILLLAAVIAVSTVLATRHGNRNRVAKGPATIGPGARGGIVSNSTDVPVYSTTPGGVPVNRG